MLRNNFDELTKQGKWKSEIQTKNSDLFTKKINVFY